MEGFRRSLGPVVCGPRLSALGTIAAIGLFLWVRTGLGCVRKGLGPVVGGVRLCVEGFRRSLGPVVCGFRLCSEGCIPCRLRV